VRRVLAAQAAVRVAQAVRAVLLMALRVRAVVVGRVMGRAQIQVRRVRQAAQIKILFPEQLAQAVRVATIIVRVVVARVAHQ